MNSAGAVNDLLDRLGDLLTRIEALVPPQPDAPDWSRCVAFRWRKDHRPGYLQPVLRPHRMRLGDLHGIDRQKAELVRNTRQFVAGLPANNALLWGSRGTGKSSLIKALLNEFSDGGLRMVEVDKNDLIDLPDIVGRVYGRQERFILFCDDLSFEADDPSYKALKAALDGSLSGPGDNTLIYATSNRRHLVPEYMGENLDARRVGDEIHHSEAVEEKISLSERFGLWLSFYPFSQDAYLNIAFHWLDHFSVREDSREHATRAALEWALAHGSRSGRIAYQFARDWAGRTGLEQRDG